MSASSKPINQSHQVPKSLLCPVETIGRHKKIDSKDFFALSGLSISFESVPRRPDVPLSIRRRLLIPIGVICVDRTTPSNVVPLALTNPGRSAWLSAV